MPLGRRLLVDDGGEGLNREIAHVYLLADDRPLRAFEITERDVDGLVELATDDLVRIVGDPEAVAACTELHADGTITRGIVPGTDLVPAVDGYWIVLAVMADRFARGERPLAI